METDRPILTIADLKPGDHLCVIYETEEEHRAVITPFLRRGLEGGEKVLYIVDARTAEGILDYLRRDGVRVDEFLARGQLGLLTCDDSYLKGGVFDPERMIATLRAETDRAVSEGYSALRVTGEMTWAFRGLPGSDRLIEYETLLNRFFPGSRCLGICQYDRRRFAPEILLEILRTHPFAVIGTEVYRNFYYVPVEEITQANRPAAELRRWLTNLASRRETEKTLQESEGKYRTLVETAAEAIVLLDRRGIILEANPRTLEISGFARDELVGKSIFRIIPLIKMEKRKIATAFLGLLRGKSLDQAEWEFVNRRGEKIAIHVHYSLIKEGGAVSGVSVILEDVTERQRAEAALKKSAQLLRDTGEMAKVGGWELDLSTKEILLTEEVSRIHGLEPGDKPKLEEALNFYVPEYRPAVEAVLKKAAETGEPYDLESLFVPFGSKDKIWVRSLGRAIYSGGKIVKLAGTFQNIDKYKRVEEAMWGSERKFKELADSLPQIVFQTDRNGRLTFVNRQAFEIFGYSPEEFERGLNALDMLDAADRERGRESLFRALSEESKSGNEFTARRKDGSVFPILIHSTPVIEAGETIGLRGIIVDITERKRAEEELVKHRDHLEELVRGRTGELQTQVAEVEQLNRGIVNLLSDLQVANRKLEDMTGRLKDTNTELESFAYTVSHDLRAPLRAIQGFTQALLDDYAPKLDANGLDYAQRVVNAAQRMDTLIADILAYSRLIHLEFELNPVSLGKAVAEALRHLETELAGKRAEVKVLDPLPAVKAYGPILTQVLENLVSNALKFVPAGAVPRVTIRAEEKDGWARLWVEDNGIGIPPEYHERIFRVFERLHGIESYPGTGIGLAIVSHGIARMGGKIGLESEVGIGSRFWIELPIAESEKKSM